MIHSKTAMVWGANGGIGRALVEALIAEQWTVVAFSRQPEQLEPLTPLSFVADVTNGQSVQNAILSAAYEINPVQLWIYAAGDIISEPIRDMGPENWQRILGANLTGAYLTSHYSRPLLAEDAHLVFLGAISERLRLPGLSAYAAAKSGLEAFADALRKEERKRRVTVVRPVAVNTSLWEKVPMRLPKDAAPAAKVAGRILEAYHQGHSGFLDLS